jgi:hypothetical protein
MPSRCSIFSAVDQPRQPGGRSATRGIWNRQKRACFGRRSSTIGGRADGPDRRLDSKPTKPDWARSVGPDCVDVGLLGRRGFCYAAPGCAGSLPTVPRSGQDDAVTGDEVPAYPYAGHRPRLCPHGRLPSPAGFSVTGVARARDFIRLKASSPRHG